MGADTFFDTARGKTPTEAFRSAVEEAQYQCGHGGYTGTIAEKNEFTIITVPDEYAQRPADYARKLIEDDDPRINDKWGPAGCIKLPDNKYLFFGWASI